MKTDDEKKHLALRVEQDDTTTLNEFDYHCSVQAKTVWSDIASGIKKITFADTSVHTFDLDFASEDIAKTVYVRRARISMVRLP